MLILLKLLKKSPFLWAQFQIQKYVVIPVMNKRNVIAISIVIIGCVFLALNFFLFSEKTDQTSSPLGKAVYTFELSGAEQASDFFTKFDVEIGHIIESKSVRPFYSKNLPKDIWILSIDQKRELFIHLLLPAIIAVNAEIEEERKVLTKLHKKKKAFYRLTWKDQAVINKLATKYSAPANNFDKLYERIDHIPVSLALAQAIIESGWGTSRFSREGIGLYGVHLPKDSEGEYIESKVGGVKVAAYESIYSATKAYAHVLNTTKAYEGLRKKRLGQRLHTGELNGADLAETLTAYSEIGDAYVKYIKTVISRNKLELLNDVKTMKDGTTVNLMFN